MENDELTLRLTEKIERTEGPMLVLGIISVVFYMAELLNFWVNVEIEGLYQFVARGIDAIFAIDLLVKMYVLRSAYITGPWFVIDFFSALPIISSIGLGSSSLASFRVTRAFRFFRILRTLQLLKISPSFKIPVKTLQTTPETKMFNRVVWIVVPLFSILFASLISWIDRHEGALSKMYEFYLVLGAVLGILLIVLMMRYQIPAFISTQMSTLLNAVLPDQVARYYATHPYSSGHIVRMPASIVNTNISQFITSLEKSDSDLTSFRENLENIITVITDAHNKYDLIVDKYVGDTILSFRGGDLVEGTPEDHAWRVVKASVESIAEIKKLNSPLAHEISIGGSSTDTALIGAIGIPTRISYTIVGPRIRLAANLSSAVKKCGTSNLFCDQTYALTKSRKDIVWRRFGLVKVDIDTAPLSVYEAFCPFEISNRNWIEEFHLALENFEMRRFTLALQGFARVVNLRPEGDIPAEHYMEVCQQLLLDPPGPYWEPVTILFK